MVQLLLLLSQDLTEHTLNACDLWRVRRDFGDGYASGNRGREIPRRWSRILVLFITVGRANSMRWRKGFVLLCCAGIFFERARVG